MSITLLCPRLTCRAVLCVPDHVRGKHVRCGECGLTLLVPATAKSTPGKPKVARKNDAGDA